MNGAEGAAIADNLSAHKTGQVKAFLEAHPKVHLHFTPTYSSWLNQVELWFSKIERDVIARGVFTSVPDLKRKLMRYIGEYNKEPKTVKWKYFDPTRRITPQSTVTVHWSAKPMTNAKAIFSREMSLSSRWPTRRPMRSRRTVTGLSAITCDLTRNPLFSVGSIVTRKSGASLHSKVIWQITTDACSVGRASV